MATEIERKFLVKNDNWRKFADSGSRYIQGYFTTDKTCSIRVRIEGDHAALNFKSATIDITRTEFNYPIPVDDASEMLESLCIQPLIIKTRYHINHAGQLWELDVFEGENDGLVIAEIELDAIDSPITKPDWVGEEVSDDPRYYNVCLVSNPYKNWAS